MFGFHAFAEAPFATLPNVAEIVEQADEELITAAKTALSQVTTAYGALSSVTSAKATAATITTARSW